MIRLEPESQEMMDFYRESAGRYSDVPDGCEIPRFSKFLRNDLLDLLKDGEAVDLLEFVTRMGNFGNSAELDENHKAVSRLLKAKGVNLPRGKRTGRGLKKLVEAIAPMLLYFGLPLATSERSRIVEILRRISEEVGVRGDPRDELRRLRKIDREHDKFVRQLIAKVIANALAPTKVNLQS